MISGGGQDDDYDSSKNDVLMENEGANPSAPNGTGALFPLARIKKIMKADKDVNLVSADAVHLISSATEMFLDTFVKKASDISQNEKRRTILYKDFASAVKQDVRYSFLHELIPDMVSVQTALEAQKQHGMVPSFTPAHSPVMDTDDHFDSFKSSNSNVPSTRSHQNNHSNDIIQQAASIKSSKSDFFAKRTPGNVNFLLNSNSTMIGDPVLEEELVDISDDTH